MFGKAMKICFETQVSGPSSASITALKLLRGTVSYYQLVVQLPAGYFGQITVSFVVCLSKDFVPQHLPLATVNCKLLLTSHICSLVGLLSS